MTYAATANVSSLTLGKLLKTLSKGAVYNQLSSASEAWDYVKKVTDGDATGREYHYEVMTSYGPAAVQATGFSATSKFPIGQRSVVAEATAQYKDFDMTIEYDLTLENKSGSELVAYAKPLAHEVNAKTIVAGRLASAWLFGEGSGAIGVNSTVTISTADTVTCILSTTSANAGRSHSGWFELNDKLKCYSTAGVLHNTITTGGGDIVADYYLVTSVNQDTDTVILAPYTSADVLLNVSSATPPALAPAAGDVWYRYQTTANDLTAISTNDYNTLSEVMVGLESLAADDGRIVNGLTMSGATAGNRFDCSGAVIAGSHFNSLMLKGMRRTGGQTDGKKITVSKAWMHDRTLGVALEQAAANRQFFNTQDVNTGIGSTGHKFKKMFIDFESCEFVPLARVWILPDQKGPLEFAGRDYSDVDVGGQGVFLKGSSTGQYYKQGQKFLSGAGVLAARHPAAINVLTNFVLA